MGKTEMREVQQTSIKRKLTTIIMVITTAILILVCAAFIVNDLFVFKQDMARELTTLAEIIGANCAATLTFRDTVDARAILSVLQTQEHITQACIYLPDGSVFASYKTNRVLTCPFPEHPPQGYEFKGDHLYVFTDIFFEREKIGTVYVRSNLDALDQRFQRYLMLILIVVGLATLAAFLLTAKLQRIISVPILNLARTAKMVSDKKDFSIRAAKNSSDEIGYLTERFNEMLTQIQDRDRALQEVRDKLQAQARELKQELHAKRRFEQALRDSEARFRDLFDNAPDIYVILDPVGKIIDFNKNGYDMLGYSPSELVGAPLLKIVCEEDMAEMGKEIEKIRISGQLPKHIETTFVHKNGSKLWVSSEFSIEQDPEGNLQSIRVICRDITERKKLQEKLERAQRLESAGRIAGQIAHDFNNLLGPLAAYPALLRENLSNNKEVHEMLDEMESAANKIAEINQQLLSMGRRGHYAMEPMHLNDLIDRVLLSHSFSHLPNVGLDKELAGDIFPIKGGSAQLTRALANLFINGFEALLGEGTLKVRTQNVYLDKPIYGYQIVRIGEYVRLDISDTGTGIKPEILDKIFDPFFTTKTMDRMRGSGLGLSVVHGIVEDHKAYITVESKVGRGTTFSIYFPAARDVTVEESKTLEKAKGGTESILIVDDDPIQRRVTGQLLKRLGYQIRTAKSGEQAVELVTIHPQDLLILDMVMDGIDGTETYRQILSFQPRQKAIVLSGYAMSKRVRQAMRLGAGGFISKPISLQALASAVRDELDTPDRKNNSGKRPQSPGQAPRESTN